MSNVIEKKYMRKHWRKKKGRLRAMKNPVLCGVRPSCSEASTVSIFCRDDYKWPFSQEISCFNGFIPSRENVKVVRLKTAHFCHLAFMKKFSLKNAERNFYKAINLSSFAQLKAVAHEPWLFPVNLIINNPALSCPHILNPTCSPKDMVNACART